MRRFVFQIRITTDSWLEFYRRPGANVVATSFDGRRIQFKAKHLQKFITHNGVSGTFVLSIDGDQNFVSLERHQ